ncbi:MAG: hypothetical protein K2I08_02955 [Muribaculaceae bacterium]|nr:hypothetical protein [Muribaculaceae bacterium]
MKIKKDPRQSAAIGEKASEAPAIRDVLPSNKIPCASNIPEVISPLRLCVRKTLQDTDSQIRKLSLCTQNPS